MRATIRTLALRPAVVLVVLNAGALLAGCAASLARPGPGQPLHPRTRSSGCVRGPLPDPGCTPGSVRTTDLRLVCTPGSSRRARNVAPELKHAVYRSYGIVRHRRGAYEIDHLVPLELGGANDAANLWPEAAAPRPGFHEKDALENELHDRVCAGRESLRAAQAAIAHDWLAVWQAAGRPGP
jgi:hypothetical protein